MEQTQTKTNKLLDFISVKYMNGELNNNSLVQIIEHCGDFLNLRTRSEYAKENGISYNTAKNYRENVTLFNTNFIIDNE